MFPRFESVSSRASTASFTAEIQSYQARIVDLQALVSSIVAELQMLEPPTRPGFPTSGSPDAVVRIYEQRMAAFERAMSAFNRKVAELNSRLQLAFRTITEVEHKIDRAQSRMRRYADQEATRQAEAQQRELEKMRRDLERAARDTVERQRQRDQRDGSTSLSLVRTSVGGHLDGDGRADLRGESFMLMPHVRGDLSESLHNSLEVFGQQVGTLEVLPAGADLDAEAIVTLDRRYDHELSDTQANVVRSMLLNEQLPNGRAAHDVWTKTADAMGIAERRLVELVVGAPDPAELDQYAADFVRFSEDRGARLPNDRQAEDFSWRLAAGQRVGDPAFFLTPLELPEPVDVFDEIRMIRELRDINATRWDGALGGAATDSLLAAVREPQPASGTTNSLIDVFPISGDQYNIGYDRNWNDFDQSTAFHNSDFGAGDARHQASGLGHPANDVFAPRGTPMVAPFDGVVTGMGFNTEVGGNWIEITRGDTKVYYAHMDEHLGDLHEGDQIAAGDPVGTLGDTGSAKGTAPHLHIQIKVNGDRIDPLPHLLAARERPLFAPIG